jgi:hypothetical protein
MENYDNMTDEDFDSILAEIIGEHTAEQLLAIPGAYEVFSEHFNNEVLSKWESRQPTMLYWLRMGDQSKYELCDDLTAVADEILSGISDSHLAWLMRNKKIHRSNLGISIGDFDGYNYISLYKDAEDGGYATKLEDWEIAALEAIILGDES